MSILRLSLFALLADVRCDAFLRFLSTLSSLPLRHAFVSLVFYVLYHSIITTRHVQERKRGREMRDTMRGCAHVKGTLGQLLCAVCVISQAHFVSCPSWSSFLPPAGTHAIWQRHPPRILSILFSFLASTRQRTAAPCIFPPQPPRLAHLSPGGTPPSAHACFFA